jgi:predicted amidophosphoribosyltransferase
LNRQKRKENMRGAFRANRDMIFRDKRAILVDDVTTSGATASEAAEVLKNAGVSEVQLAVLALAGHDLQE